MQLLVQKSCHLACNTFGGGSWVLVLHFAGEFSAQLGRLVFLFAHTVLNLVRELFGGYIGSGCALHLADEDLLVGGFCSFQ